MAAGELTVELENVALRRGERLLVGGLSLSLRAGGLGLVTGPNGSGKTTLLRSIAGLSPVDDGKIFFGGREVTSLDAAERSQFAYQGHLEGLKRDLSIEENLQFFSKLYKSSYSVSTILTELGLEPIAGRLVRHLSAGQKRRTALASLRMSHASLWLLDEPLTNLDADGRALVRRWLDAHLDDGGMAIVATHRADDLERPGATLVEL